MQSNEKTQKEKIKLLMFWYTDLHRVI